MKPDQNPRRMLAAESAPKELQEAILGALPASLAIIDQDGLIVAVNSSWRRFAVANALPDPDCGLAQNYLKVCQDAVDGDCQDARQAADGIRRVLRGDQELFEFPYACHSPTEQRWCLLRATATDSDPRFGILLHQDNTSLKLVEEITLRAYEKLQGVVVALDVLAFDGLPLDETMTYGAAQAKSLTGASAGFVELVEGGEMVCRASCGTKSEVVGQRLPRLQSLSGVAVASDTVLVCEDCQNDPRVNSEGCERLGARSMVVAPLHDGPQVFGILKVISDRAKAFAASDVSNLQILASSLGAAIQRQQSIQNLRASEAQYRLLFISHPHPMWTYDATTMQFLAVNDAAIKHYGYHEEEFLALTLYDIEMPEELLQITLGSGEIKLAKDLNVWFHRKKDGSIIEVELPSDGVIFNGRAARLVAVNDVTERRRGERELARTHRALKMLSSCNEALTHIEDESALMQEVCRICKETGGYRMVWVGYAQDDESHSVLPVAHFGDDSGYLSEIRVGWGPVDPDASGPVGQVIRSGQVVLIEDIALDHSFLPWLTRARNRRYRGVLCLPLSDRERTFGALVLYSAEVLRTTTEELQLLRQLSNDLAFGIWNLRARGERNRLEAAVVKIATCVSASTGAEFFEQLVENMAEALGAQAALVAHLLPGEPLTFRTIAAVVEGQRVANFEYVDAPCLNLTTKDEYITSDKHAIRFPGTSILESLGAHAYAGRRLTNAASANLGVLFLLFREPLKQPDFIASTMRIFAARAASELERQNSETRVREQAALLDAAHESIYVKDLEDKIIYWNKGAERAYGWPAAEALGRRPGELLWTDEAKYQKACASVLAKGEWQGELQKLSKDGRSHIMEVSWTLVRDAHGHPKSVLSIGLDISEKKKLEAQFLRAQRMESIGTLASGIAHDLNNVLAPILMSVELLRQVVSEDDDLALLETLKVSAQRGADLVKQVLGFARGVDGRRIAVNLIALLEDLFLVMRDTFPKSINLHLLAGRDVWPVIGDPTQLHQVFMNLCVNARDAMPTGGSLTVKLENVVLDETYAAMNPDSRPGCFVMIKVGDTGEGIPPEIRETIFEPFFTTKEIGKGTGLGLSTTLAIVRSHDGFIHLYSDLGKGTKFKIYLPADTSPSAAESVAVRQTHLPQGHGELILVVDDEEAIRTIIKSTLERFGYSVLLASHGAEAVSLYVLHQGEIALVLTDMAMPIMDGPALIVALKAINPQVNIVGSSGLAANESYARAVGAGVQHFIPKPYTAEAMLQTLHLALLGRPSVGGK